MDGAAVGRVIASRSNRHTVGDHVRHHLGWREYAVLDAEHATAIDASTAPVSAYLGVLGMTGLTAYVGMAHVAQVAEGDTVFVSGAAGAVGSQAGQIARLKGATRVIGSAGSARKAQMLVEDYGFDAAFNYHDGPVAEQLAHAAPDGIDVYFDNVGGDHLDGALANMRRGGRIAVCGLISQYNATAATPMHNLMEIVGKRLTVKGMLVGDWTHLAPQFTKEVRAWIQSGELHYRETVIQGIDRAVEAFLGMLRGDTIGKTVVSLSETP